jgi:tripartite-type tricarboxylate transporter receptor subunit TctC
MTTKSRPRRAPVYAASPNLARAHERGLADFEAPTWFAVFLPHGASEPIIRKFNQAAFATADTPSVQERLNVLVPASHKVGSPTMRAAKAPAD